MCIRSTQARPLGRARLRERPAEGSLHSQASEASSKSASAAALSFRQRNARPGTPPWALHDPTLEQDGSNTGDGQRSCSGNLSGSGKMQSHLLACYTLKDRSYLAATKTALQQQQIAVWNAVAVMSSLQHAY